MFDQNKMIAAFAVALLAGLGSTALAGCDFPEEHERASQTDDDSQALSEEGDFEASTQAHPAAPDELDPGEFAEIDDPTEIPDLTEEQRQVLEERLGAQEIEPITGVEPPPGFDDDVSDDQLQTHLEITQAVADDYEDDLERLDETDDIEEFEEVGDQIEAEIEEAAEEAGMSMDEYLYIAELIAHDPQLQQRYDDLGGAEFVDEVEMDLEEMPEDATVHYYDETGEYVGEMEVGEIPAAPEAPPQDAEFIENGQHFEGEPQVEYVDIIPGEDGEIQFADDIEELEGGEHFEQHVLGDEQFEGEVIHECDGDGCAHDHGETDGCMSGNCPH